MTTTVDSGLKIIAVGVTTDGRNASKHADGLVRTWSYDAAIDTTGPEVLSRDVVASVRWHDKTMVVVTVIGYGDRLFLAPWPFDSAKLAEGSLQYGARPQITIYDLGNYSPSDVTVISGAIPQMATGWISRLGGLKGIVELYSKVE
jgi:hypothetical protein